MARIIRYYERGEWKYATVKDIGEISELMTANKTDIVSAINEIYSRGGSVPPDLEQKIQQLEALTSQHTGSIDGIYTDLSVIDGEITTVSEQQALDAGRIQALTIKEEELRLDMANKANQLYVEAELLKKAEQSYVEAELATRVTGAELTTQLAGKAGVSYVDGELAKKLTESKYQQEYDATQARIDEKLNLTQYQQEYGAIVSDIASKVDVSEFEGVKGRVSNVETSITNINGELEQKVSSVDYESDVGINKWLVTRFTGLVGDMSQYIPDHAMLPDTIEQETVEMLDGSRILPDASDATIYRFFTNVYTSQAKVIGLNMAYQDSVHVMMNGASLYQNKSNAGEFIVVSMSLRKGWNTVEILLGNKDGQPSIDFVTALSSLVDKMTTVIGVGDRNEYRLKRAETSIQQNAEQISLSATKTEVSNLGNRVESAEAELVVQAGKIESKVEQETFNNYSQRLESAESSITQQAGLIASKVEQTEFNLLNGKVNNQETEITQMSGEIALKASQSDIDALAGEVNEAKASLTVQAGQIATKVEGSTLATELAKKEQNIPKSNTAPTNPSVGQMWLDTSGTVSILKSWTGTIWKKATPTTASEVGAYTKSETDGKITPLTTRLTSAETEITQTKEQIELKATKEEVDAVKTDVGDLVTRVSTAETAITQNSDEIALRATKTELNGLSGEVSTVKSQLSVQAGQISTKVEGSTLTTELAKKEGSIPKSNTPPTNPTIGQMWLDTSTTVNQLKRWTGTAWAKSAPTTASEVGAYTKSETDGKTATALSDAKGYTDGQVAPVISRLTSAETAITQTQGEIALKATKTDVYTRAETDTKVGSKADKSALDAVTARVSKAESSLSVQSEEIALKVSKTEFENLAIGGRNLLRGSSDILKAITIGDWNIVIDEGKHNTLAYYGLVTGDVVTYRSYIKVLGDHSATVRASLYRADNTYTSVAGKYVSAGSEGYSQVTFEIPSDVVSIWFGFQNGYAGNGISIPVEYKQAKAEKGSKATDWSPAPEDVQGQIDSQGQRISSAESSITQQAGQIALKVSQTEVNQGVATAKSYTDGQVSPLANRISSAETSITANTSAINLKASKTDVYTKGETDTRVGSKADKTALDAVVNRVSATESSLNVQAGEIALKVSQTDFENLSVGGRNLIAKTKELTGYSYRTEDKYLGLNISRVVRTSTTGYTDVFSARTIDVADGHEYVVSFYAKADANRTVVCHFYSPNTTTSAESSTGQIKASGASDGGIAVSITPEWKRYWVKWGQNDTTEPKSLIVGRLTGAGTLEIAGVKLEKGSKATDWSPAPEDVQGQIDSQGQRISSAESSITQLSSQITSKVETSTFNSLAGRVSSAESTITQQASSIALRVEKDKIVSMINQTPETIKILASKIDIQGAVTFSSFDSATQTKINNAESTASTAKSTADSAKTTANSAVSTANSASSTASTAVSTANTAKSTADSANTNANSAKSTASSAVSTANSAVSTANSAKSTADSAISNANTAIYDANTAIEVAKAMASGVLVREDVKFQEGMNSVTAYNNANNGAVVVSRVAKPSDAPTTSTHALKITHTGSGSPNLGGFVQNISARANAKFVIRYIIKLPTGYKLNTASNSMGTGYSDKFLGNDTGTGKYTEYIRVVECGSSGTFSSGGHVHVSGATPTSSNPLEWYLASIEQYDVTDWEPVTSGVANLISTAQATANSATSKANTADSKAGTAQSTANTAVSKADTAQGTANTANSTANSVQTLTNGWKHPSNTTLIHGGKIYTDSVTAQQVNVTSLSALSANIGKVTAGTIEGVSFSSMAINKADYLGRTWSEKTDIAVGAVGFRNSATINASQNDGKSAVQETTLNHDGLMVYARDDKSGVNSFVSVSGTNIQFGGVTSNLTSVGQHFVNADGEFSVASDQKMTLESRKSHVYVNGSLFRSGGVMESNLTHTNGYFTVKSFSTSSYGSGQAEIWFNANDNRLTVSSRIGAGGTIGTKLNVQDLEVDNLIPKSNGYIDVVGNGEVLRLTSSTGSLSTYAVYARGTDNLLIRSESEIRAFKRTSTAYVPVRASSFPTGSSIRYKDNLEIFSYEEAKEILDNTQVFKYHLKSNLEARIYDKPKIGLISEMVPKQVRDEDGVDVYSITSTLLRINQAHSKEIDALRAENFALKEQMTFVDAEHDRQIQELRNEIQEIKQMMVAV